MEGTWIPLMEYAIKRGVSLSTLRRHIKAEKIAYRIEAGRYLVFDDQSSVAAPVEASPSSRVIAFDDRKQLERELQKAREEIAELKTLIAFYEEQLASSGSKIGT